MTFEVLSRINNKEYLFAKPLTIFQACLEKRYIIPRFCYHISLRIAGNCRMCLIEEKSSLKPQAACAVSLTNGLSIFTNTEIVKKAREGVLEYLLINHPLDCPICDQGGECDLQDQTMVFGSDRGRFYDFKRSTPNKNFGFLVKSFLNRCIHCARCTRFLQEIAGAPSLQLLGRGYHTEISNYVGNFVENELSGNIIDLCPVGALTSKPYAFKARVWELVSIYTHDIMDAFGANIQIDFRGLEVLRILPKVNKDLNEEWISDRTRFFYDALQYQRLSAPHLLTSEKYKKIDWINIFRIIRNYYFSVLKFLKEKNLPLIVFNFDFGAFLDFETAIAIKIFNFNLHNQRRRTEITRNNDLREEFYFVLSEIFAEPSSIETFFLLGLNLRYQSPLLNLKVRKNVVNYSSEVYLIGYIANLNYEFTHLATSLDRKVLNFMLNKQHSAVSFGSNLIKTFPFKLNRVSKFISELTQNELHIFEQKFLNNFLSITLGQNEILAKKVKTPLSLQIHHQVEDNYILSALKYCDNLILIPARFYFEKEASYVNNNYDFFDTAHHFSFAIPGTKEEWRFFFALYEYLLRGYNVSCPEVSREAYLNHYYSWSDKFIKMIDDSRKKYVKKLLPRVQTVNFFSENVVTRSSQILSLCAKKLSKKNSYTLLAAQ